MRTDHHYATLLLCLYGKEVLHLTPSLLEEYAPHTEKHSNLVKGYNELSNDYNLYLEEIEGSEAQLRKSKERRKHLEKNQ